MQRAVSRIRFYVARDDSADPSFKIDNITIGDGDTDLLLANEVVFPSPVEWDDALAAPTTIADALTAWNAVNVDVIEIADEDAEYSQDQISAVLPTSQSIAAVVNIEGTYPAQAENDEKIAWILGTTGDDEKPNSTLINVTYLRESDQTSLPLSITYTGGSRNATKTLELATNDLLRNHDIIVFAYLKGGSLWVEPIVLPWIIDSDIEYKTDVTVQLSTASDRDKFLRYDSDKDFDTWTGSYVAAAYSQLTTTNPAPLYTPPLRLVSSSSEPLYLHLDNPFFRFVKNTDSGNVEMAPETDLKIEAGPQETTFYVLPIQEYDDANPVSRECHLSLISGDATSGLAPARVPLRSQLPGFAAGTDEVWFYWLSSNTWQNYTTSELSEYLKMYPEE
jgi:hypothetical protein